VGVVLNCWQANGLAGQRYSSERSLLHVNEAKMTEGLYVCYARVSTEQQGRSGLGLEAQRAALAEWLKGDDRKVLAEFTEVESGKRDNRPQLTAALALCRRTGAILLIAKLDRLTRNVAFLARLMESGVKFVAVDNPHATKLTIHILAAVAEDERDRISARTKAALAAAKAQGKKLGWSIPGRISEQAAASKSGVQANSNRARLFASNMLPVIRSIQAAGITVLADIAQTLTARGFQTARGYAWHATSVKRVLDMASDLRQA
jgi:DNA invertase Pin-like site-specific DNA recombinase